MSFDNLEEIKRLKEEYKRRQPEKNEGGGKSWVEMTNKDETGSLEDRINDNEDNIKDIKRKMEWLEQEINALKRRYKENFSLESSSIEIEFSDKEVQECERICLKEIEVSEKPLYPSDIARKYDMDVVLVSYSLEMLAKEGKIVEVADYHEYKNNI